MFGSGWRCTNHFVPFKKNSLLAAHKGVRKGTLIDDSVSSIQIGLTSVFWGFFFPGIWPWPSDFDDVSIFLGHNFQNRFWGCLSGFECQFQFGGLKLGFGYSWNLTLTLEISLKWFWFKAILLWYSMHMSGDKRNDNANQQEARNGRIVGCNEKIIYSNNMEERKETEGSF